MLRFCSILRRFLLLAVLAMFSCEKAFIDEVDSGSETPAASKQKGNLIVSIFQIEQIPFSDYMRIAADEVFTHLNFAIYDMGGTRLKQVNQKWGDNGYGTASMQLDEGQYQLVVVAHSSNRNPVLTNLAKIQFNNSDGYTDTYVHYEPLTLTTEAQTVNVALNRVSALCRFIISDPIPEGVTQMKFQYKGGSGHFNAMTGLGVTNSTQIVTRQVQAGQQYAVFDLYTFLHQKAGTIRLIATALDAIGDGQYEREFEIPMQQNQITWFNGLFFTDINDSDHWLVTPNIPLDKLWANEVFCSY